MLETDDSIINRLTSMMSRIRRKPENPDPSFVKTEDYSVKASKAPAGFMRDEITLKYLREILDEDRNAMTRHPYLKHLFARYDAIVNHVDELGYPKTHTEPARTFVDRVNTLADQRTSKDNIKRNAYQSRQRKKSNERNRKRDDPRQFGR